MLRQLIQIPHCIKPLEKTIAKEKTLDTRLSLKVGGSSVTNSDIKSTAGVTRGVIQHRGVERPAADHRSVSS